MFFHVSNLIQTFQTDWVYSSNKPSLVIYNYCSTEYPVSGHPSCESVIYKLSRFKMMYFILGFKSCSPTFLVAKSINCRPPSNQPILWYLHFSPFLTKGTLLAMCLVWLLYLSLLAIHTVNLLSNIIRGDSSGTIYWSLFNNSWINILKGAKSIPPVHAVFYSLYAIEWANGPGTCVQW